MPRKSAKLGSQKSRSGVELFARLALGLSAAVLGLASVTHSIGSALTNVDPAMAFAFAPFDGQIGAIRALDQLKSSPQAGKNIRSVQLAREALRREPIALDAFAALGLAAQLDNKPEEARRIFQYALQLSRRDPQARMWAIEENVGRGDISGALLNYDLALRTSVKAQGILFPILASAISEPKVRSILLQRMSDRPSWEGAFISFLVNYSIDPEATVAFFRDGEHINLPVNSTLRAMAVNGLVAQSKLDSAWEYYVSLHKNVDAGQSRDPKFTMVLSTPSAFDWMAMDSPAISATIDRKPEGGAIDFSIPPVVGGVIASQMQMLPPGAYKFSGLATEIQPTEKGLIYWSLDCFGGLKLGSVGVSSSASGDGTFNGMFTVPQDCVGQRLSLNAKPTNDMLGISGKITEAKLVRIRR